MAANMPATTLAPNAGPPMAAGVACTTKDGRILLLRRNKDAADQPNTWDLPGGWLEPGEDPVEAARRELAEECGLARSSVDSLDLRPLHRHTYDDVDYATFATAVGEGFRPFPTQFRDPEHTAHMWAPIDNLPPDTHPGLQLGVHEALERLASRQEPDPTPDMSNVTSASGGTPFGGTQSGAGGTAAPSTTMLKDRGLRVRRFNRDRLNRDTGSLEARQPAEVPPSPSPPARGVDWFGHSGGANVVRGALVAKDAVLGMDWSGVFALGDNRTRDGAVEIACDRITSRSYDHDGFLHIARANISKGNVCPYLGKEIPDGEQMGLDPNREYMLWRHPEELKKAAPSFNGKPILTKHVPVSSADIDPKLIVGTTGRDAVFDGVYLTNSLDFWPQAAIDGIETSVKRQLSCGYRYTADMRPGKTPDGVPYDGVMRNIVGNHVALVEEGRAGPDVIVADGGPRRHHWGGRRIGFIARQVQRSDNRLDR